MPTSLVHSKSFRINTIAAAISICVSIVLMATKFYLYRITGSSAILSDALESIINVVAASFALTSVIVAAKPADDCHPYGHGKIEYFSAGFEGAMIVFASIGIFITAVPRLLQPAALANLNFSLVLLIVVGLANMILGFGLMSAGKRTGSLTLVADGKHVLTDAFTSIGVLVGLFLAKVTGWLILDPLIAVVVGINILFSGWKLVRLSFSRLMDASEPALLQEIVELLSQNRRDAWIDIHRLRALRSGSYIHVDFHMIVPRECSLEQVHAEIALLEKIIIDHFHGQAGVLIHADPCKEQNCPIFRRLTCSFRRGEISPGSPWTYEQLIQKGKGDESGQKGAGQEEKV